MLLDAGNRKVVLKSTSILQSYDKVVLDKKKVLVFSFFSLVWEIVHLVSSIVTLPCTVIWADIPEWTIWSIFIESGFTLGAAGSVSSWAIGIDIDLSWSCCWLSSRSGLGESDIGSGDLESQRLDICSRWKFPHLHFWYPDSLHLLQHIFVLEGLP